MDSPSQLRATLAEEEAWIRAALALPPPVVYEAGAWVVTAESAREALALSRFEGLRLLDSRMPLADGIEVRPAGVAVSPDAGAIRARVRALWDANGRVVTRVDATCAREAARGMNSRAAHEKFFKHTLRLNGGAECAASLHDASERIGENLHAVYLSNPAVPLDSAFIVAHGTEALAMRSALTGDGAAAARSWNRGGESVPCHFTVRAGDFYARRADGESGGSGARARLARMACKMCAYFWDDPDTGAVRLTIVAAFPPSVCISDRVRTAHDIVAVNARDGRSTPQTGYLDKVSMLLRKAFVE